MATGEEAGAHQGLAPGGGEKLAAHPLAELAPPPENRDRDEEQGEDAERAPASLTSIPKPARFVPVVPRVFDGVAATAVISINSGQATARSPVTRLLGAWRRWSVSPPLVRLTRARITFQWWLAGKPLPSPNVVKQRTLIGYQKRYGLQTLVETGTYTGEMVQALSMHVERLISIEVDPGLHARAVTRFAGQRHIRLLQGDSATLLPGVLESLTGPALFWLDGHYMGSASGRGAEETPIMAEMTALVGHTVRGHVVLIDDARLFDGTGGYPRLEEFTAWVKERRPGTAVRTDGDIIRCVFDAEDSE